MSFPRLLFISGPLQGQSLDLTATEVFIGRDEGNTIVLNHGSVSRKHCRIHKTGESYEIEDLESKNGTFLNGIPKRAGLLQHGADIRIGSTHILFLNRPEEMPAEFLMDDPVQGQSTVILRESDLVYENERLMARNSATEHRLSQLLQLAKLLSQLRSADELPALFAALLEAVPVQRAALMLGANAEDLQRAWFWNRQAGAVPAFRLSRTVLRSAFSDRTFVMHQGLLPDSAASLVAEGVQSVICVPLLRPNRVLGAIYMDSARSAQSLTEDHLQFVSAAAGLTALAIDNLRMLESLREENQYLRDEAGARKFGIVGQSVATQQLFEFIRKAAPADLTVLVLGESGVGKELVARAIHAESSRAARNFVAVNCAAFTESLLESDLFGHEKGAFTGAIQQQKGKFERADGGTLFLDEISELSPSVQAKLLRVLQEREFERVGGSRTIRVDVRIIAATNRDLKDEIRKGAFREDLYYRINVLPVRVLPLRERPDDVLLLATHFLARSCDRLHKPIRELSAEARACLLQYSWPGNVRELENAIERAVVLSESEILEPWDFPEPVAEAQPATSNAGGYQEAVTEVKTRLILEAIQKAAGNITEAARLLRLNPNYLHRLIRNLNLRSRMQKGQ